MENGTFNAFDVLLAIVLLASGTFAFKRGLVREIMSLGTWVLASLFAFSFYPLVRPYLETHIKNAMLADAAGAIGLFCLAIVTLVPLGDYLAGLVKSPTMGSIDRSLGFVFGILRGFLVMCLLYLGTTYIWPEGQGGQPEWLAQAKTKPALAYGVGLIKSMIPEHPGEKAAEGLQESRDAAARAVEDAKKLEDISTPVPTYKSRDSKPSSYGNDARDKMNNLMDRNSNP